MKRIFSFAICFMAVLSVTPAFAQNQSYNISKSKIKDEIKSVIYSAQQFSEWGHIKDTRLIEEIKKANNTITQNENTDIKELLNQKTELLGILQNLQKMQRASKTEPIDCSYFIVNPSFHKGEGHDESNSSFEGWKTENKVNNGDLRLNFIAGRNCWNSWSSDFSSMKIYQNIEGLAPGIYQLSCYAMTNDGNITNQHAYIKTPNGIYVSSPMTIDSRWNTPQGWERMNTEYAIVEEDGKLQIGFESTSPGNTTAGWFCVTDFSLYYCGDIEENDKINRIQ